MMRMEIEIICPFCNGKALIGYEGAMHLEPVCKTFSELDVEDYVHECYEIFKKTSLPKEQQS
jgi:hypothetical protein